MDLEPDRSEGSKARERYRSLDPWFVLLTQESDRVRDDKRCSDSSESSEDVENDCRGGEANSDVESDEQQISE